MQMILPSWKPNPSRQAHNLVTILTELFQLPRDREKIYMLLYIFESGIHSILKYYMVLLDRVS
jgi:hypothetical protein